MSDLNMQSSSSFNINYEVEYDIAEEEANNNGDENFEFIPEENILKKREDMIKDAIDSLSLGRPEAILAMIYLEWDIDKLNDWLEDPDNNRIKAGIELSPETKESLKQQGVPENGEYCLTCGEEKNDTFLSLSCGHQFCGECWTEYLKEKLKNPLAVLFVKCQQIGCTCVVPEKVLKKLFANDTNLLNKLNKAIYKNFINGNKDFQQCPNPQCHFYTFSEFHLAHEIKCKCGTIYCFKCSREPHKPCSCELYQQWLKLNDSNNNDDLWIEANTKECPHCHQKIEKSYGCNYMLCDKKAGGCGFAFCYVCETDWAQHSQDHFKCNKYTEAVKNKEKNANKLKEELQKIEFYYKLCMNNNKACEILNKKTREEIEEKIEVLVAMKNISNLETAFIIEALDTVIKGKTILKYTYIVGYYMNDGDNKNIFEHEQGILQYWTEELHRRLIDNEISDIIQTEGYDSFTNAMKNYRNTMNILTKNVQKLMKGLSDDVESKFNQDVNKALFK